jgi:hypothetical protein
MIKDSRIGRLISNKCYMINQIAVTPQLGIICDPVTEHNVVFAFAIKNKCEAQRIDWSFCIREATTHLNARMDQPRLWCTILKGIDQGTQNCDTWIETHISAGATPKSNYNLTFSYYCVGSIMRVSNFGVPHMKV